MKLKKYAFLICMALIFTFIASGCGEAKLQGNLNGKWYYIYDTETVGLNIKDNGTAVLDGQKYECTYDDACINLTDKKGCTQGYRYSIEGEGQMYLYKPQTFKYTGSDPQNGLIGVWVDVDNGNSSFEFTTEGTFKEDSYIPGYYTVDEENGSILLVYNDHYYDTTIYFTLKDGQLFVEYPWPMVKEISK